MPEQPPDPLHYEMKIPPEPAQHKQRETEKPASDQKQDNSQAERDKNVVRGKDELQDGDGSK